MQRAGRLTEGPGCALDNILLCRATPRGVPARTLTPSQLVSLIKPVFVAAELISVRAMSGQEPHRLQGASPSRSSPTDAKKRFGIDSDGRSGILSWISSSRQAATPRLRRRRFQCFDFCCQRPQRGHQLVVSGPLRLQLLLHGPQLLPQAVRLRRRRHSPRLPVGSCGGQPSRVICPAAAAGGGTAAWDGSTKRESTKQQQDLRCLHP